MRITTGHWIKTVMLIGSADRFSAVLAAGCQQKMADQPSYKPAQPSDFFADGRSERPAVAGTVARGHLQTDVALFTGRRVGKDGVPLGSATPTVIQPQPGTPEAAKLAKAQYDQFVDTFPFPMTEPVLEHGYQRFMIYCVVCHDPLGTGQGKIVERGYTAPPSYHIERLRKAPVGYLFAVISEGYGSMPSYARPDPRARSLGHRGLSAGAAGQPAFSRSETDRRDAPRAVRSRTRPLRQEEHRHEQQCLSRSQRHGPLAAAVALGRESSP